MKVDSLNDCKDLISDCAFVSSEHEAEKDEVLVALES